VCAASGRVWRVRVRGLIRGRIRCLRRGKVACRLFQGWRGRILADLEKVSFEVEAYCVRMGQVESGRATNSCFKCSSARFLRSSLELRRSIAKDSDDMIAIFCGECVLGD